MIAGPALSLDAARDRCWFANSYSRMPTYLELAWSLEADDRMRLLGEIWSDCDNIGEFADGLLDLLPETTDRRLMTDAEWGVCTGLLAKRWLRVYRGALEGINEHGYSWSTSRVVAAAFPRLRRYRAARLDTGEIVHPAPVLVTASVRPRDILAVKMDRNEMEIIAQCYTVRSVERLSVEALETRAMMPPHTKEKR